MGSRSLNWEKCRRTVGKSWWWSLYWPRSRAGSFAWTRRGRLASRFSCWLRTLTSTSSFLLLGVEVLGAFAPKSSRLWGYSGRAWLRFENRKLARSGSESRGAYTWGLGFDYTITLYTPRPPLRFREGIWRAWERGFKPRFAWSLCKACLQGQSSWSEVWKGKSKIGPGLSY